LAGQETENKFKMIYEPMNNRFLDLIQVSFCAGPEAENELKVPCEPLKLRFLDFT